MRDARIAERPIRHVRDSRETADRRLDRTPGFPAPDGVARDDDGFAWMGRERARFNESGRAPAPRDEPGRDTSGFAPPKREQPLHERGGPVPPNRELLPGEHGGPVLPQYGQPTREYGEPVSPTRGQSMREGGPWSRDEWDVALADGAVYRIFRDRVTDGWFIDGVLD
jgi:hypothetical protein